MVELGKYIEACDERNSEGRYTIDDVKGVSINKIIIETKADMNGVDLHPYKLFKDNEFCFVPITSRNGDKITLAVNDKQKTFIVSSSYCVFKVKDANALSPMFLYLLFNRPEFDRYARFNSWGSAREAFSWEEMCRVQIPLPSIEVQREYVAVYKGLQDLAEQNEALLEPLSKACGACLAEMSEKYDKVRLGDYIEEYVKTNSDNSIKEVRSVSIIKFFMPTGAKVDKSDLRKYKIVPPKYIAYVQTTKNENCFAFALNTYDYPIVVSAVDRVIYTNKPQDLCIEFLALWFRRKEWDRYAIYHSWGSARENFSYADLCDSQIPLPPIDVQQSIVNLFKCAEEARSIAAEARATMKTLCPAMIQRASHN